MDFPPLNTVVRVEFGQASKGDPQSSKQSDILYHSLGGSLLHGWKKPGQGGGGGLR